MSVLGRFAMWIKPFVLRCPPVAKFFRHIWDNWQMLDDPMDTPMGFKFVGNAEMQKGRFEPDETELVTRILKSVDVVINIGANIGYYCCFALKEGKHVVAFEPIINNLRYLYKNIKGNHWEDRIEIFPMALSNRVGTIEIFGGGTGASLIRGWAGSPDYFVESVPVSTLDIVLGSRFHGKRCLVLIDIEGAEQLMLEGASAFLLHEPRPIWMVEITVAEHQPKGTAINPHLLSTFQLFWTKGYEAFIADKHLRPILPAEIESIVKSQADSLYSHNFLFIESDKKRDLLG
ncbi:MAG: FkbM family methyltransferase [Pseudomonadota bacterium]